MARKKTPAAGAGVQQLAVEGLNVTVPAANIVAVSVRAIEQYLDTTTWLLLYIGPLKYCVRCKGALCNCPSGPIYPLEHEDLKVGDTFTNIGDAVPHLAENNGFPIGSIFVTKQRLVNSCVLTFKQVCQKLSGKLYLREDIPVAEIEHLVDWARVLTVIEKRLGYDIKVRELRSLERRGSATEEVEQLDLGEIEP